MAQQPTLKEKLAAEKAELQKQSEAIAKKIERVSLALENLNIATAAFAPSMMLFDTAILAKTDRDFGALHTGYFASAQDVLKTLADHSHGKKALNNVWEENQRSLLEQYFTPDMNFTETNQVSYGRSPSGVGVTSLHCPSSTTGKPTPIHIIHNSHFDRTIIVTGEKVSPKLRAAFAKVRTVIVSQHENDAAQKVAALLNEVVPATLNRRHIKEAFAYRNDVDTNKTCEDKYKFEQIVTDPKIEALVPKYVIKM